MGTERAANDIYKVVCVCASTCKCMCVHSSWVCVCVGGDVREVEELGKGCRGGLEQDGLF